MSEPNFSYSRIEFCERYSVLYEYDRPFHIGSRDYDIEKRKKESVPVDYRKRSDNLSRIRQEVHKLISCNMGFYPKFLTLTTRKTVLDYNEFLYMMKQFFKKMKRNGFDLKYLWIIEHQTKRGLKEGNEGSYHAHIIIFNDEFIPFDIINKCWDGNTDIKILKGCKYENNKKTDECISNVASYVTKYITKDNLCEFERNAYHCSRGLQRPITIREYAEGYYDSEGNLKDVQKVEKVNFPFNTFKSQMKVYNQDSFCFPIKIDGEKKYCICKVSKGKVENMYEKASNCG